MLRFETEKGWRLITHPEHAALAGRVATSWGNELFQEPVPRAEVLAAIFRHDDGWKARDAFPLLTKAGKPAAFSKELVGKYSAFEEIEMSDYLAVRGRALEIIAAENPFAAVLVSMHTCNLLTERADRTTIAAKDLPLLDDFVAEQLNRQRQLKAKLTKAYPPQVLTDEAWLQSFRLLQACDNMSLCACVCYDKVNSLLHPLALVSGAATPVKTTPLASDTWELDPFPLNPDKPHQFDFSYREIHQKEFSSLLEFQGLFNAAKPQTATLKLVPPSHP
jgi:hypothetical protein